MKRDKNLRKVYAYKGLSQIPRLLSLQDRNEFSPTYGCFHREYWLNRTVDFPSAIAQFGVHSLALAYSYEMPQNPYYKHPKIREWAIAGIKFWMQIQKEDGSFDEFYPNERGWAGPTGFLLYVMVDSYNLLKEEFPEKLKAPFLRAVKRSAHYLAKYDEPGVLANHHAMAVLPIYEAYSLLKQHGDDDRELLYGFHLRLDQLLSFCDDEGWALEYDGVDLGYLSATISFIAKLRKRYTDKRIEDFLKKALEFTSYFVYPNGYFGGSIGSRQTLHFYPHGYELLAREYPIAGSIAEVMLKALSEGKLVPPEIQEDRYFLYRIPEFLLSYIDYYESEEEFPPLPYQKEENFQIYWKHANIFVRKEQNFYTCVNLAKGGVIKHFRLSDNKLILNDCGIVLILEEKFGKDFPVTTQWIDNNYNIDVKENELTVEGNFHTITTKLFDPVKMIIFRLGMLAFGWHPKLAYEIKGGIRNLLMLRQKKVPVRFLRKVRFVGEKLIVEDSIKLVSSDVKVKYVKIGDEVSVRYVPQSRYFQLQELEVEGMVLSNAELEKLNNATELRIEREIDTVTGEVSSKVS